MVANTLCYNKNVNPPSKCCDSDTDDSYLDQFLQIGKKSRNSYAFEDGNFCENRAHFTTAPASPPQKPKSILVHHENETSTNKKSKPTRFVSFTLDDQKKPFTSSIYYGVKSYLHHFYEPVDKTVFNGDSFIDDDFEFVVEPGRRRKNYWFFPTILVGALMLIAAAGLLIAGNRSLRNSISGTPPDDLEIEDQPQAITLHDKIETWQFLGLIMFCGGGIIIMLALLISAYEQDCGCYNNRSQVLYPSLSSDARNTWIRYADVHPVPLYDNRIPLSEEVTAPQMDRSKN